MTLQPKKIRSQSFLKKVSIDKAGAFQGGNYELLQTVTTGEEQALRDAIRGHKSLVRDTTLLR
jgi:hypothetical protein